MNYGKIDSTNPVTGLVREPSDQTQGGTCALGDKVEANGL